LATNTCQETAVGGSGDGPDTAIKHQPHHRQTITNSSKSHHQVAKSPANTVKNAPKEKIYFAESPAIH
jgi:hypothetical protein